MACLEMSDTEHKCGLFLELRKRLQSGLLIVGKDIADSVISLKVTGGDSYLQICTLRGKVHLALPAGISHEQGSCMQVPCPWLNPADLHLRMRVNMDQRAKEEAFSSVGERILVKESYCFHCQGCKTRLLEDRVFTRVLPLPNGNWNAIVDDWCCHPDPFANKKLLPRAEDCLLGDTFLLLARDSSCKQTLTEEERPVNTQDSMDPKKPCRKLKVISCKGCSSVLGEAVAPETLKLYITQILVEPSVGGSTVETPINRSLFLEHIIAAQLLELSSTLSTFHFTVQTPDEKAFLLLWLLNTDSIIAALPEQALSHSAPASSSQHSLSHRADRALKVVYIDCHDGGIMQRDIVTSWEVNAIGHPLVLPLEVCEELLQVVMDSNSSLPLPLRCMTSYKVAYLRL